MSDVDQCLLVSEIVFEKKNDIGAQNLHRNVMYLNIQVNLKKKSKHLEGMGENVVFAHCKGLLHPRKNVRN
jgi:hypothetical protein